MSPIEPLLPERLARHCDPASLGFDTTAELGARDDIVGQDRAVEAIGFAISMDGHGYNVFAMGPEGTGKHTAVRQFLDREAARRPVPDDWCYVHDFADARRPRALRLPAGRGRDLRDRMADLIRELGATIPAALESDEYRSRRLALEEALKTRRDKAMSEFEERARSRGVAVVRTPIGFGMAPLRDSEVLDPEAFGRLSEEEQQRYKTVANELEADLTTLLGQVPIWEREHRRKVHELNEEVVRRAVDHLIAEIRDAFKDQPQVGAFLDAVESDVVARAGEFLAERSDPEHALTAPATEGPAAFRRCRVNLLVDHAGDEHAPVIHEDLPTHPNLVGKVEHIAHLGTLVTDFMLIKGGALHRANGGYLVLDVRRLLQQPFSWEELKRALRAREIRMDGVPQALSWMTTTSIEPEPIPLDVKVILLGERLLFHLLAELDPDVAELFRIQADFNDRVDRTAEIERRYAGALATIASREGLRPLDAGAVAAAIDHAARDAEHADHLSTNMRTLTDLVREANRLADAANGTTITRKQVAAAIEGRRRRAGRMAEELRAAMVRGMIRVDTSGRVTSQVNGLSVLPLGADAFGWPTRITAQVRLGRGDVVDIEREVELGGPIHSKGVLILAGFLGGRFGRRRPLALQASLVFEQSYGQVEGDSASMAELCALMSAIGDLPLDQSLAITGSVDQLGRSQAVGGVNHKVEGFFDLCAERGLTGGQGVLIPAANVQTLMLRDDVVQAVRDGRFAIYPVDSVDEAIERLAGIPAGEADEDGDYPPDSVNGRVAARLAEMADIAREAATNPDQDATEIAG